MNIYVSDELSTLKQQLINHGYTLINNNYNDTCDVIIIDLKKDGIKNINAQNLKKHCTLIIDSGAKKFDEIEQIISSRLEYYVEEI